jgi:hypothetical protein
MHKNLVGVVIRFQDLVFYGKHAEGPYKGKWGFASVDSSIDARPLKSAIHLAETSSCGLLDNYNVKKTTTPLGIQVYEIETTNKNFPEQLQRVSRFNRSCFPLGASPPGMSPWSHAKWSGEIMKDVDPYTKEMQQFLFDKKCF